NALFGFEGNADAVPGHELEQAQEQAGVGIELLGRTEMHALARDGKVRVGQARTPVAELREQVARLCFGRFQQARRGAMDGARMPEVRAHELGRLGAADRLLRIEAEYIIVPAGLKVKVAA